MVRKKGHGVTAMTYETSEKLLEIIRLLNLLGNPTRVKILALLSKSPMYLSEITRVVGVTQQAVIRHLRELENAGLIRSYTIQNPLGPNRKYYEINHSLRLNITIGPEDFNAYLHSLNNEQHSSTGTNSIKASEARLKELLAVINRAQRILKLPIKDETDIYETLSDLRRGVSILYFLEAEIERLIESLENLKV